MYDTAIAETEPGPIEAIEFETAVLARNLEMLRRRGEFYVAADRAGYLLLLTLEQSGSLDVMTLAAELGLDPSTAARQVAAAHKAGLVTREPDPHDRRRSIVAATARGKAVMREIRARRRAGTAEMLAGWSEKDRRAVAELFHRYNQAIAARYR
ncbi:MarR family winged helix-turn-helix transcriptional regulator [Amycolatopsis sp.]|uniref:MarR family winged helix-turn-helix transcriptional regulator n=1 Tax=Amycolatopsis sp. TaxID=37632 RepID=UPI002CCC1EBC|nr:MarR family transcriptional regulator [Amycolatopsis sp.]HVV11230.1 MarR family transcriptional regulator [Amycolatopsis sp.]